MDVAASIAGLVSLGIQVTQALIDYYTAYKGRESEVASTMRKLNRLLDMLKSLSAHLNGRKFKDNEKDLQATIENAVQDCEEYIHELRTICEKLVESDSAIGLRAETGSSARKLAYPFRKSTLHAIEEDVDDAASHISRSLQMFQLKNSDNIQDDIADNKVLLELIHDRQVSSDVHAWLKAPDVSLNYNEASKKDTEVVVFGWFRAPSFLSGLPNLNHFCGSTASPAEASPFYAPRPYSTPYAIDSPTHTSGLPSSFSLSQIKTNKICLLCCGPSCYSCPANMETHMTIF
jgi:ankyrin repeat domain-containing protein 50